MARPAASWPTLADRAGPGSPGAPPEFHRPPVTAGDRGAAFFYPVAVDNPVGETGPMKDRRQAPPPTRYGVANVQKTMTGANVTARTHRRPGSARSRHRRKTPRHRGSPRGRTSAGHGSSRPRPASARSPPSPKALRRRPAVGSRHHREALFRRWKIYPEFSTERVVASRLCRRKPKIIQKPGFLS